MVVAIIDLDAESGVYELGAIDDLVYALRQRRSPSGRLCRGDGRERRGEKHGSSHEWGRETTQRCRGAAVFRI
jgi:hypothetical protein